MKELSERPGHFATGAGIMRRRGRAAGADGEVLVPLAAQDGLMDQSGLNRPI
ncbi:MAG TPA: hypothetical protein VGI74_07040 [Streptosporangiaceae bacterium]|jgi:hypothetical protein